MNGCMFSLLSLIVAASTENAAFGALSAGGTGTPELEVTHGVFPVLVQPGGNAGGVTPSKSSPETGGQEGVTVGVAVGVAVAVGLAVGLAVGVGVGDGACTLPGAWITAAIGAPVLKKPTVALVGLGAWSASNRKL